MYTQCPHCKKFLATTGIGVERVNDLYKTHNVVAWAKNNLRILSEMAADHGLPDWYVREVTRICDGLCVHGDTPTPTETPADALVAALLNHDGVIGIRVAPDMAVNLNRRATDGRDLDRLWSDAGPALIVVVPGAEYEAAP